jgi:hypothetical protein
MNRNLCAAVTACFALCPSIAAAQTFDNASVIALHRGGLGEATLLAKIKGMPCGYDVSTNGLIDLKGAGLSDVVIAAMVERCNSSARAQGADGNATDPAAIHPAGIYVMENWRQPAQMQIIRPSKAGALKVTGNGSLLFPRVGKFTLPGSESHYAIKTAQPSFYFYFKTDDRNVSDFGTASSAAAQSPDEFTLVRCKVKSEGREIEMGKVSVFNVHLGIDPKEAIAFRSEESREGVFKVTTEQPLVPGQYAFVLTGDGASARIYDFSVE